MQYFILFCLIAFSICCIGSLIYGIKLVKLLIKRPRVNDDVENK